MTKDYLTPLEAADYACVPLADFEALADGAGILSFTFMGAKVYRKADIQCAMERAQYFERIEAATAQWAVAKRERHAATRARWLAANPDKMAAINARRRASELRATPAWANQHLIYSFYRMAKVFGLQVDHIIPLVSEKVCGLHSEHNLQLLTKSENARKGNRFEAGSACS